MVDVRSFLVQLKNHWNSFLPMVQPYLNYDYDRCMNVIMIGAGIRPLAGAEPWKQKCLILYRLLGFYQFLMGIAKVGFGIQNGNSALELCSSTAFLVGQIAIYAKVFTLGHYDEAVRQSKIFLASNLSCSGDPDYDATVRRHHATWPGKVALLTIVILLCEQVLLLIPDSARDTLLGIPQQFNVFGPIIFRLLREAYLFLICIFWGYGYFCCPLTIIPLLKGLKHELLIIARGYEAITERAFDDQNNAAGTSRKYSDNVLMLKQLKHKLEITIKQHAEVLRIIHLVQPLVNHVYAIIYFSVIVAISIYVFTAIRSEITLFMVVVIGMTGVFIIVECYIWCHMIHSLQEAMKMIAGCVAPLAFRMQHSVDNHSEYIEMRTSIMIIQLNASQGDWFNCGGIFPISIESFGDLCMVIYKFATFLLKFE